MLMPLNGACRWFVSQGIDFVQAEMILADRLLHIGRAGLAASRPGCRPGRGHASGIPPGQSTDGKEIAAQTRHQQETKRPTKARKPDDENRPSSQRHRQQIADSRREYARTFASKPALESHQRVCANRGGPSPSAWMPHAAAAGISPSVEQPAWPRTGMNGPDHREHEPPRPIGNEQKARDPSQKRTFGTNHDADAQQRDGNAGVTIWLRRPRIRLLDRLALLPDGN